MLWGIVTGVFLWGLTALAAPLVLHWLQRRPRETVWFPAFDFLLAAQRRSPRTNQWRKWLVLLLRLAAITLIVLAFCRPYRSDVAGAPESATILLWDDSASLRAGGAAVELARRLRQYLAEVTPERPAVVGLLREAGQIHWSGEFSGDGAALRAWFEREAANQGTSSFAGLPQQADFRFREVAAPERRVVIFADRQALPWSALEAEAGFELATGCLLEAPDGTAAVNNAGLRDPAVTRLADGRIEAAMTVFNDSGDDWDGMAVRLGDALATCDLAAGAACRVALTVAAGEGAWHGKAELEVPDGLALDDGLYLALDAGIERRVMLTAPPGGKFDYLASALGEVSGDAAAWPLEEAGEGRLVIWQRPGELDAAAAARLGEFVAGGGTLVLPLAGDAPELSGFLAGYGVEMSPRRGMVEGNRRFGAFDYSHPALARMAEWSSAGWFEVLFYRTARPGLPEGARVLVGFDDGAPALAEVPAGRGRLLLWCAAGFDREDGNWGGHYSFLPFWREIVRAYTASGRAPAGYSVGDRVAVGPGAKLEFLDETGQWREIAGGAARLDRVGIYRRVAADGRSGVFAVNIPAGELDLRRGRVRLPEVPEVAAELPALPAAAGNHSDEWFKYLLALAALCVLAEMALANRSAL